MEFTPSTLNGIRDILHPIRYNPYHQLMKRILRASIDNCSYIYFRPEDLLHEKRNWLVEHGFTVKHMEDGRIAVLW